MRRLARVLAAALVAAGVLATPAVAEEQPAILKAYGLDWIERVRDDAWPQPKEQRPVICLLDTGVAVTPDTPEDNPLGPIVARLALDGGTGLPQGDTFEHRHGTDMASVIAAPRNGYGTVGVFPQARIVSVRVTEGDETFITPQAMVYGASLCVRFVTASGVRLAAIVMAESAYDQRPLDGSYWRVAAARADAADGLFVAAVGNQENAQLVGPAAYSEVLSVAAGDPAGNLCPFANYSPSTAAIGPGCLDPGIPAGSSAASAAIGGLIGAYATRHPEATAAQIRAAVDHDMSTTSGPLRRFDGTALQNHSFQGSSTDLLKSLVVPPAVVAVPVPANPVSTVLSSAAPELPSAREVRLWRPRVVATRIGRKVRVSRTDRGPAGTLVLRLGTDASATVRRSQRKTVSISFGKSAPVVIEAWVEGKTWRSFTTRVRVARR